MTWDFQEYDRNRSKATWWASASFISQKLKTVWVDFPAFDGLENKHQWKKTLTSKQTGLKQINKWNQQDQSPDIYQMGQVLFEDITSSSVTHTRSCSPSEEFRSRWGEDPDPSAPGTRQDVTSDLWDYYCFNLSFHQFCFFISSFCIIWDDVHVIVF